MNANGTMVDISDQLNATAGSAVPTAQGIVAIIALAANVICLTAIIRRSIQQKKNPYKNEIFTDQKDFIDAMNRAALENK